MSTSQDPAKLVFSQGNTTSGITNVTHPGSQKRLGSMGVLPRRGGRKKTLSLNPEEREALENLIEEVIIDGGMGDSESASSDEEDNSQEGLKDKSMNAISANSGSVGIDPKVLGTFKVSKKFYPGQLKVALKHMTDLPPRFSRKLKKAEKYLELNAAQKKAAAAMSIKEEDEEETSPPINTPSSNPEIKTMPLSPKQPQNDKEKNKAQKEKTQKDLKKTIRSLLSDLDQYVDEKDRTSVSLDLPGAVSCADLERESLGIPLNTSEAHVLPLASPKVHKNVAKSVVFSEPVSIKQPNNTVNVDKAKETNVVNKTFGHTANNYNTTVSPQLSSTNHSITTASTISHSPAIISSSESANYPTIEASNKASFSQIDNQPRMQQYPCMTPVNFVDGSSIVVQVPQMVPPVDFSVPPPAPFSFPTHFGLPSSQDSYVHNQFQPKIGFMELTSSHVTPNYPSTHSTTPMLFQPYSAVPAGQAQHVPPFTFASNPSIFLSRFNYPSQAVNYFSQFHTRSAVVSPASPCMKSTPEYQVPNSFNMNSNVSKLSATNSPHQASNVKTPFRIKQNVSTSSSSTKADIQPAANARQKLHKHLKHDYQVYTKPDAVNQAFQGKEFNFTKSSVVEVSQNLNYATVSQMSEVPLVSNTRGSFSADRPGDRAETSINSGKDVIIINNQSSDVFDLTSLTNGPPNLNKTSDQATESCATQDAKLPDSTTERSPAKMLEISVESVSTDISEQEHEVTTQLNNSGVTSTSCICSVSSLADISLNKDESLISDGSGLEVTLGKSFVQNLKQMFAATNCEDDPVPDSVFLHADILKQIFLSIQK